MVIETDIGNDPDDFFAITYMLEAGVDIEAILVSKGSSYQLAIVNLIRNVTGLDFLIGTASDSKKDKTTYNSMHHEILKKYKMPYDGYADDLGVNILKQVKSDDIFLIGPILNFGEYLKQENKFKTATMQGGFLPYRLNPYPYKELEKFKGLEYIGSFNPNGSRKLISNLLDADIKRRFVGKNVCHTVEFTKDRLVNFKQPKTKAGVLFLEAADIYFSKHDVKKFHDPTAAVCHLHPEIGQWVKGRLTKMADGWTTVPDDNGDDILANIDYDRLWNHLYNWN